MKKLLFVLPILAILSAPTAHAFSLTPVVGVNFAQDKSDPTTNVGDTYGSKMGTTFGLLAGFELMPMFELETGLKYVAAKPKVMFGPATGLTGGYAVMEGNAISIPVVVKFEFMHMFNVGVGGFYEMGMGDLNTTVYDAAGNIVPAASLGVPANPFTKKYGYEAADVAAGTASGTSKTNYGVLLTAGVKFPVAPAMHLGLAGEYEIGLANRNVDTTIPNTTEKSSVLSVLAGLSIDL